MGKQSVTRTIGTFDEERLAELAQRRAALRPLTRVSREDPGRLLRRARQKTDDATAVVDLDAAERILGSRNETLAVNFLERGAAACRAVARVSTLGPAPRRQVQPQGTGFLASPWLMITNHHVIRTAQFAGRCVAEFDAQHDVRGRERPAVEVPLDPGTFFATSADDEAGLDITVVALSAVGSAAPGEEYGYLPVTAGDDQVVGGEYVNVVQHPAGALKQVAFRENLVLQCGDGVLWYQTDTEQGSSGAPVLDDDWDLVAVHRRSVARTNDDGAPLNQDGTVHTQGQPDALVDWCANEGLQAGRVFTWLAGMSLTGRAAVLRDELLRVGS